jgi:hypothetical protein
MQLKQIGIEEYDGKPVFYDADVFAGEARWVENRFLVRVAKHEQSYVKFSVFEAESRYRLDDGSGWVIGSQFPDDVYLTATFKFDGCAHFDFGDEGYLHLCSGGAIADHINVVKAVYDWAFELLNQPYDFSYMWEKEAVDAVFGGAQ